MLVRLVHPAKVTSTNQKCSQSSHFCHADDAKSNPHGPRGLTLLKNETKKLRLERT